MKTSSKINVGVAAVAALALALPAGAFAHPSVWETTAKITNSASSPVPDLCSGTDTRKSYVVSNHGFTMALNETNCAVDKGMLNYKKLPSSYRATLSLAAYLAAGDTGAQPHATCRQGSGVVDELWGTTAGTSAITAWQTAKTNTAGGEPFFNYVPWQKTSAGLDDDPTKWIPVVLARTGVDLSSYSTVDEFTAACAGIGGVYTAADKIGTTMQSMNSGFAHDITATVTAAVTAAVTAEVTAAVTRLETDTSQRGSAHTIEDAPSRPHEAKSEALSDVQNFSASGTEPVIDMDLDEAQDAEKHTYEAHEVSNPPLASPQPIPKNFADALTEISLDLDKHDG